MLLPAEIESKTLIPALRAILAKKLAQEHDIREDEISKIQVMELDKNYIRGLTEKRNLIQYFLEKQVSQLNKYYKDLNN